MMRMIYSDEFVKEAEKVLMETASNVYVQGETLQFGEDDKGKLEVTVALALHDQGLIAEVIILSFLCKVVLTQGMRDWRGLIDRLISLDDVQSKECVAFMLYARTDVNSIIDEAEEALMKRLIHLYNRDFLRNLFYSLKKSHSICDAYSPAVRFYHKSI